MTDHNLATNDLTVWGVGTTRTFRVHWLLHELGLDYETRRIESRTGETLTDEYIRLNPKQKIPTLVHGDFVLSESLAIMRYLRRISAALPFDQYQRSAEGQGVYDEWASFILMELDATSLYIVRRHRDLPQIYGEAPLAVSGAVEYFEKMMNAAAPRIGSDQFLWGSCFSELDILMAGTIEWARAVGVSLPTRAEEYHARVTDRDTYRAAKRHNFRDLQLQISKP
jgi:glutathione S-transferase